MRSFTPENPKSREFIYGLKSVAEAALRCAPFGDEGLYTIVNETVDVSDGGVSGVIVGDLIEFAPGDTPRCVEKPGTVSFRREVGLNCSRKFTIFGQALDYDLHIRFNSVSILSAEVSTRACTDMGTRRGGLKRSLPGDAFGQISLAGSLAIRLLGFSWLIHWACLYLPPMCSHDSFRPSVSGGRQRLEKLGYALAQ